MIRVEDSRSPLHRLHALRVCGVNFNNDKLEQ